MSELTKFFIALAVLLLTTKMAVASQIDDYQRSFDAYRDAYEIFEIKNTDYIQSRTYAAEEAMINSAKTMLLHRADTWNNYWKLVATNNEAQEWLTKHKQTLELQKTKNGLNQEALLLNEKLDQYLSKAFERNVDLIDKQFLDSLNQLRKLNEDLLTRAENQNIEKSKKDLAIRGLELNIERLNILEQEVQVLKLDLMNQSSLVNMDEFAEITAEFQPLYQKMTQYMQITRELSENIEW